MDDFWEVAMNFDFGALWVEHVIMPTSDRDCLFPQLTSFSFVFLFSRRYQGTHRRMASDTA
jgi:hypothetical protein